MKRVSAVLLSLMLAASTLSGCGSAGSSAAGGSATTAAAAGTSAAAAATVATEAAKADAAKSGDSAGTTELAVSLWDYSNTEYYKTLIAGFTATNPKYTVKVLEAPANEYDDKIQIMLSGGDTVDVVYTKGTPALSALVLKNQMLALDDYIAKAGIDGDKYSGLVSYLQLDGKTYAMPFRKDNNMIFYNKDLFDKAGVAYPTDGMTMDQYRELAKKMTSGEGDAKVYGAHIHTWPSNVSQYARRTGAYSPLEKPVDVLLPYYRTILAMQNEDKSVMDYASLKAGNIHYSGVFYNQKVAMLQIGTWFINMLSEQKKKGVVTFEWGVCSLPDIDGTGNTVGVGGVTPVGINAKAANPDGAWDFVSYVTGAEGAKILASCGILPGYTDDSVVAEIEKLSGVPSNIKDYLTLDNITIEQIMHPKAREVDKIISEEHDLIMVGAMSPEDGLAELQTRIDEALAAK